MAGLLNISEMSAQGLHLMLALAKSARADGAERLNAGKMAADMGVSAHTLHKVVGRLVNAGLVDSARGVNGGLRLAVPPDAIPLIKIIQAVDAAVRGNHCLFAKRLCSTPKTCPFTALTGRIEKEVHDYFYQTTLADLLKKPVGSQAKAKRKE